MAPNEDRNLPQSAPGRALDAAGAPCPEPHGEAEGGGSAPAAATATESPRESSTASYLFALLIALIGIGVIAFLSHWDGTLVYKGVSHLAAGSQLVVTSVPPVVFFMVLLLVLVVNPLLRKLCPWLALGRGALLTVLAAWLLTAAVGYEFIGSRALCAIGDLENPADKSPITRKVQLADYLNPVLFLSKKDAEQYKDGLTSDVTRISPKAIPWKLWLKPLVFWGPFLIVTVLFASNLVRIFHRQWSEHELLAYPIAGFGDSLLERPPGRSLPGVFYIKVFWAGFILIAFIYLVNGLHAWFPKMVNIPLSFSQYDMIREFPFLNKYCGGEAYSLFRGWAYPLVIALGVFLPTEIAFTCWAGWLVMVVLPGIYFLFSGEQVGKADVTNTQVGMYVAMLAAILIVGRRHYWNILKGAAGFRPRGDKALRAEAWACRFFVLMFAALVLLLMIAGMDLLPAFVTACSFGLMVILIARMTAEIGVPWLTNFAAGARSIPLKFLGPTAIGPRGLAVMGVIVCVLDMNAANSVAAQETTYRKLLEKSEREPRWRFNLVLFGALIAALAATAAATLWDNYSYGSQLETGMQAALKDRMEEYSVVVKRLQDEGRAKKLSPAAAPSAPTVRSLATVGGRTGIPAWTDQWQRLGLVQPEDKFWRFFFVGAAIIGLCAFLRLRFTWWPFHPLPFLFFDSWAMSRLWLSFLLAWIIKSALLRVGGGKFFGRSKPFFIGVIVGLIVMVMFWSVVGMLYYLVTHSPPPAAATVAPML